MHARLFGATNILGVVVSTALIAGGIAFIPATAASADPLATVTVGPEQLLTGSTGITVTKEGETVSPVSGYRSTAAANFVTAPGATDGTALQLSTGTPGGAFPSKHGKIYIGESFPAGTAADALTAFGYSSLSYAASDPAPYLSVEFYNGNNAAGHKYLNLTWTPGSYPIPSNTPVSGGWQSWDTTNAAWATTSSSATFIAGITPSTQANPHGLTLADAVAAIANPASYTGTDTPLQLIGAHVSFGDSSGGYDGKSALLDDISLTMNGSPTNYQFTAPYAAPCVAPTSGLVGPTELADPTQWQVHTEYQPTVVSSATATFDTGPTGALAGGSLTMASGAGTVQGGRGFAGKLFVDRQLNGCTVQDLTDLSYRTYTDSSESGLAPYVNLEVALPTDGVTPAQTSILVWSPSENSAPTPTIGAWTTWTPFTSGNWRVVGAIGSLTAGSIVPWSTISAAIPTASLQRGVELVVGDSTYQATAGTGWSSKTLQVDSLTVGIDSTQSASEFTDQITSCPGTFDSTTSTYTLTADCTTAQSLFVPDGWTIEGAGHTLTATETLATTFTGAVLQNAGGSMTVENLDITTVGWDNPGHNSGGNLAGIRFKAAAGSLSNVSVNGISHGNGVQEGNGIDIDNFGGADQDVVTADQVTVTNYQKTGIRANGNVDLILTNSTVGVAGGPNGEPMDHVTAANSLQVSRTADASVSGSHFTGNDWDTNADWSASDVLFYQAGDVTFSNNVLDGAGTDYGVVSESSNSVIATCNLISRTTDNPGGIDPWHTGISFSSNGYSSAIDNTITGFATSTEGVSNIVNQGTCLPAAPSVTVSAITATSATINWTPGTALPNAPVTGWQLTGPNGNVNLPVGTTSYAVNNLQAGGTYSVSVDARNVSGFSDWTSASFTTSTAATTPSAVTGLASSSVTGTGLTLTWAAAAGATSYAVTVNGTTTTVTGTTLVVTGLTVGTPYLVTVVPVNAVGAGAAESILANTTAGPTAPNTPGTIRGLAASAIGSTGFTLTWSAATNADSYDVTVNNITTTVTGVTTKITGLLPSTPYLVTVVGNNGNGSGISKSILVATYPTQVLKRTAAITASPKVVVYGKKVLVSGVLKTNGVGTAGQIVTVTRKLGTKWIAVGKVKTKAHGTWSLLLTPTVTTTVRATSTGYPTTQAKVTVAAKVVLKVKVRKGVRVLSGAVAPRRPGSTVVVQVKSGKTWKTLAKVRLGKGSTFSLTVKKGGTFRVVAPGITGYAAGISNAVKVK